MISKNHLLKWGLVALLTIGFTSQTWSQMTVNFTVNQPPLAEAGFRFEQQANPLSYNFIDSSFTDITDRKWYFGDGDSTIGNSIFVLHTYASGGVYNACLEVIDTNNCSDELCKTINTFVGIEQFIDPAQFTVAPNPYDEFTTISYTLPITADVELAIYDLVGAKVKTLVSAKQTAGKKTVKLESFSESSGAGIYLLRLLVDGISIDKKIVELK